VKPVKLRIRLRFISRSQKASPAEIMLFKALSAAVYGTDAYLVEVKVDVEA
jgi:hypothetical protein